MTWEELRESYYSDSWYYQKLFEYKTWAVVLEVSDRDILKVNKVLDLKPDEFLTGLEIILQRKLEETDGRKS